MVAALRSTRVTLEMIKWEHSIFALPFALTGAVLAAGGWPSARVLGWIVVCMVGARSAAMAFNRLMDAEIDAENPRTAKRALPAGEVSRGFVFAFTVISAVVFLLGAAMLNRLTLELAPVALAIIFVYSYMKRVTRWSHLVLGVALGIAPAAAWIAVRGSLAPRIVLLTAIVMLWVGSTPARIVSTIAGPDCTAFRRRLACAGRSGSRGRCTWRWRCCCSRCCTSSDWELWPWWACCCVWRCCSMNMRL
jgi:4-hydroxybenzoate polyprenyltransferase